MPVNRMPVEKRWEVETYLDQVARRNDRRDTREPRPFHIFRLQSRSEVEWNDPMAAASAMRQFMVEVAEFHQGPRAI